MNRILPTVCVLMLCLTATGCGKLERMFATATGWSRMCIDGVSYLQFTSGASVEYTREGKVKTCD